MMPMTRVTKLYIRKRMNAHQRTSVAGSSLRACGSRKEACEIAAESTTTRTSEMLSMVKAVAQRSWKLQYLSAYGRVARRGSSGR